MPRDLCRETWHSLAMSRILLPDDGRTAAARQLIDRCNFRVARLYVESPQTDIKAAFVVDRRVRLEQVAVVATSGDEATLRQLLESGLVQRIDDCSQFADQTLCSVIYLEPVYLIQFVD